MTFELWLEENHPEFLLDEGMLDYLNQLPGNIKKTIMGAIAAGTIIAAGAMLKPSPNLPPAEQQKVQQVINQAQPSQYQQVFHSKAQQNRRQHIQNNKEQLRQANKTSGDFRGGQLQNQTATSPDAGDYL